MARPRRLAAERRAAREGAPSPAPTRRGSGSRREHLAEERPLVREESLRDDEYDDIRTVDRTFDLGDGRTSRREAVLRGHDAGRHSEGGNQEAHDPLVIGLGVGDEDCSGAGEPTGFRGS
jgi:hypothetical protein